VIVLEKVFRGTGHTGRNSLAEPKWVTPLSEIDLMAYYIQEPVTKRLARPELTCI